MFLMRKADFAGVVGLICTHTCPAEERETAKFSHTTPPQSYLPTASGSLPKILYFTVLLSSFLMSPFHAPFLHLPLHSENTYTLSSTCHAIL